MAGVDGGRLRERTRSATIADVQRAAFGLVGRSGFDAVTVSEVADVAGVSPSTVYRYFGTKEALILRGDGSDQVVPMVRREAGRDPAATPVELFARAGRSLLGTADEGELRERLRLVYAEPSLTAAFEQRLMGRRDELATLFASLDNRATPRVRDDALAGALLGLLVAALDRWQRSEGKALVKTFEKAIASLD